MSSPAIPAVRLCGTLPRMRMSVRTARIADASAMARAFVDTFRAAHRDQMPNWLLETRTYETSERGWVETIAELAARSRCACLWPRVRRGKSSAWPCAGRRTLERRSGSARGAANRRGVRALRGSRLPAAGDRSKTGEGDGPVSVGACQPPPADRRARTNDPARRYYEAIGGRLIDQRPFDDEGVLLDEVVYVWDDTGPLLELYRDDRDAQCSTTSA